MILTAIALSCIIGYRVEESTALTGQPWAVRGELPAQATQLVLTPMVRGTHWYRVVMRLMDGSNVVSIPFPVTVVGRPAPPIDLNILFPNP